MRITQKLNAMPLLPQLLRAQVLQMMYKDIREPDSHSRHIRPPPKECLIWHGVTSTGGYSSINHIDCSGKGIGPEEVWGINIFKQGASFIQNPSVQMLSNPILLRSVRDSEFQGYSIFHPIVFEDSIHIFPSLIGP